MRLRKILLCLTLIVLFSHTSSSQSFKNQVNIVGQMKNVMWKGELFGTIDLDTISDKTHLYGLGPVEYLTGEVLILDGRSYKSTVLTDSTMKVEETYDIKAPFFGYSHVSDWSEQDLPETVQTLKQLEEYLDSISKPMQRPFFFRLSGMVESAKIHIVNLPKGSIVRSPDEAHRGQVNYEIKNEKSDILGFFSTSHQAIFTHHDTFLHMHLITAERSKMGHLDGVIFKKGGLKLYLPKT